jgi:DHA1 family inner membrane transport protein
VIWIIAYRDVGSAPAKDTSGSDAALADNAPVRPAPPLAPDRSHSDLPKYPVA